MAANWNNPLLSSPYVDFLADMKARDVDVLTMNPGTNIPVDSKRWNAALNVFQNWNGSAWVNLVLGGAGGGTGSSTPVTLGTMATQNSNAVAITGGSITGVALNAGDITGGVLALARGGTGASLALGASGHVMMSNGSNVIFSNNASALVNLNAAALIGNIPMANMPLGGEWVLSGALPYIRVQNGGIVSGNGLANMGGGTINAIGYYINGVPFVPGSGVPSGMMAIFGGACPAGWTRVNEADGRLIRFEGGGFGVQGGNNTHQHGFSVPAVGVSVDPSSISQTDAQQMAGNNRSFDAGSSFSGFLPANNYDHRHGMNHTHGASYPGHSGVTDFQENWPPYIILCLCRKD